MIPMSVLGPTSIKRIDGFQREWWIRTIQHKMPLRERTELVTYIDPLVDDCEVKMEIVSKPLKHRANLIKQAHNLVTTMSENDTEFLNPDDWTISQIDDLDRAGPVSFKNMPLSFFLSFWRQPLEPRFIAMKLTNNGTTMINFRYMDPNHPMYHSNCTCNMYFHWKGLFDDLRQPYSNQKILPWLKKNCEGRLYIFSDFDSIFEKPEDEFRYITDINL